MVNALIVIVPVYIVTWVSIFLMKRGGFLDSVKEGIYGLVIHIVFSAGVIFVSLLFAFLIVKVQCLGVDCSGNSGGWAAALVGMVWFIIMAPIIGIGALVIYFKLGKLFRRDDKSRWHYGLAFNIAPFVIGILGLLIEVDL